MPRAAVDVGAPHHARALVGNPPFFQPPFFSPPLTPSPAPPPPPSIFVLSTALLDFVLVFYHAADHIEFSPHLLKIRPVSFLLIIILLLPIEMYCFFVHIMKIFTVVVAFAS